VILPRLSDIAGLRPERDPEIVGLTADSRQVRPGFLFAALPGTKADGRAFVPQAVSQGAVAVLAPAGTDAGEAVLIADAEPRRAFALMAARFHARQPEIMAAVTGTNGKTSVAAFTRQIWTRLGLSAASLGTLGVTWPKGEIAGGLTTPDPVSLHATLARLAGDGVTHAAFEASSHGLDQFRLDGVRIRAAAFTNLTRDHLDYHPDMEHYARAKMRLFRDLLPAGGIAVINADSDLAPRLVALCEERGHRVLTYGTAGRSLRLVERRPTAEGQTMVIDVEGRRHTVRLPLAGAFQAGNALCALGLVLGCGADGQAAVAALEHLTGVPGRLQQVARYRGAPIFVDYAHTPDALETVLSGLRPHTSKRLVVVFGCGGDRDPGKRPQMGHIAAERADTVIVTDDNPRSEAPTAIRAAILAACPNAREIGDRASAIMTAISELEPGDILVVAGKGHERGQILGSTVHPFDDAEECRKAVAILEGEQ
jgi:UDP-N-acetylmuramoyl-L-alanyl-D-glutamate--2,6-diaminopimelate ligase